MVEIIRILSWNRRYRSGSRIDLSFRWESCLRLVSSLLSFLFHCFNYCCHHFCSIVFIIVFIIVVIICFLLCCCYLLLLSLDALHQPYIHSTYSNSTLIQFNVMINVIISIMLYLMTYLQIPVLPVILLCNYSVIWFIYWFMLLCT